MVKVEIYSYNKGVNTLYTVFTFNYHIPPKCVKTREPKDKLFVSWCTYTSNNIDDPIPLDKLKYLHSIAIHNNIPYIALV